MEDIDLGFAEECEREWLTNVYFPSKLGGKPAWLHLDELPTNEALKCSKCNSQKSFLCQVYAPFDDEYNFHRMIYVFICRTESCYIANNSGNVTIFRSQLPLKNEFFPDVPPPEEGDAVPEIIPRKLNLCTVCGCLALLKCSQCKKAYYCGAQHQRLQWRYHKLSCSTSQTAPAETEHHPIAEILFPEWEIDMNLIEEDKQKSDSKFDISEKQEMQYLEKLTASGKAGTLQNIPDTELENYVQGCEEVNDKYFQNFRKECEKHPLQIIRYKRNGKELWISDPAKTIKQQLGEVPKCELCGEDRVYEFQIMPQMLNYLKDSKVDWGVIAIYTCPKSCVLPKDKGYVQEFCIKQDIVVNK